MTDMKRVARVLDIVKDLIDRDPMVTFDDPLFNDDLTDFVRPHFVTTQLTNALKRDDDHAFDTFVKLLKAKSFGRNHSAADQRAGSSGLRAECDG